MEEKTMEEKKKEFEEPVVEKVEFDFSDRIAASGCTETTYVSAAGFWN